MSAPAKQQADSSASSLEVEKEEKIDYRNLPPVKIAIRSKQGVEFRQAPFSSFTPTTGAGLRSDCNAEGQILYATDGSIVALVSKDHVQILDAATQAVISTINRPRVEHLWFSPLHNYLATWERKSVENKNAENMFVWNVKNGAEVLKVHWSDLDATQERPIQWSFDEAVLGLLVTNEVKFFPSANPQLANPSHRLHVKSVLQFAFAPTVKPYTVATFLPSKGTDPAKVNIYTFPSFGAAASSADQPVPVASKSFFKAEEVSMKWSPIGHALLIETRTSTDKTGKSYYGESGLHLLHADGSYQGTVPFGNNAGPIQDVAWSPTGKEFMVIQGFQPAKSTLFVATNCTPIREYGTGSFNTIRWSPHGRFVMLGGFGNLSGGMDFFDHFKFKKMGSAIDRDGAKSYDWTPDGRHFITASLRPWRRVDNGYKIWTYYGEQVYAEKYDELYQVVAQPAPVGLYPNRPQSPRLTDKRKMAAAAASAAPAKPTAYIPPHLRAQGATAPSSIMKRETDSAPRKLNQHERAAITGEALPESESGGLSKNQLKRAKMKANQAKKQEEEARLAAEEEVRKAEELAKRADMSDPANVARKIKALSKKLRQIEELKEKQAGGTALNEDQMQKLAQEDELNKEMQELSILAKE